MINNTNKKDTMTREEYMKRMGEIYDLTKGNLNSNQLFDMKADLMIELLQHDPKLGDIDTQYLKSLIINK